MLRRYGEEFTQTFLGNREYTDLPRKLNVAITGCLENCTHSETQDIAHDSRRSRPDGHAYGFNVAVGGKMGSGGMTAAQPLDVFIDPRRGCARWRQRNHAAVQGRGRAGATHQDAARVPGAGVGRRSLPAASGGAMGRSSHAPRAATCASAGSKRGRPPRRAAQQRQPGL